MTDTNASQAEQQDLLDLPMLVPVLTRKYEHEQVAPEAGDAQAMSKPRISAEDLEMYLQQQDQPAENPQVASGSTEGAPHLPPNAVVLTQQGLADLERSIDQRVQRLLDRSLERTADDLQVMIKTQLQQRVQALLPTIVSRAVSDELQKIIQ